MKRSKEELLEQVKKVIGENTSDEAVTLLEDISDTFDNSGSGSTKELEDKIAELEQKVKDTDSEWRKKYTDRFFNPSPTDKPDDPVIENDSDETDDSNKKKTFDDLFTDGKEK